MSQVRKTLGLTFFGTLAFGSVAYGADLYTPPPVSDPIYSPAPAFNWTGFYVGVHGGYGWGDANAQPNEFGATGIADLDVDGFFAGGQIGYNFMFAQNFVLGVEADASWSDIDSGSPAGPGPASFEVDWFGTARARLGYAINNVMPYVTGGFAWADATRTTPAGPGGSDSNMHTGYVLGAGVEVAFTPNVTGKLEYQYLNLGSELYNFGFGIPQTVDLDIHTVRVGLNYKF